MYNLSLVGKYYLNERWVLSGLFTYSTGNPFASSGNEIRSNVSGGALGVWGGYNPTVYKVVAR